MSKTKQRNKPETLRDFSTVVEAERKLDELSRQRVAADKVYNDLASVRAATSADDADRLLAGDDLDDNRRDERLDAVVRRRRALKLAIERQRQHLRAVKLDAARKILDQRRGEYEGIVDAIHRSIPELAKLLAQEQQWRRRQLEELQVEAFHFETAPTNRLIAAVAEYQRRAVETGFLAESEAVEIDDETLSLW